jgi:ABC-type transporter Mla MlaB component
MFTENVLFIDSRPVSHHPRRTAVTVIGPLVLRTAAELRRVLHDALADDVQRLDVDLSGVTDADPAGLAMLVVAARRLQARPDASELRLTAISYVCGDVMRRLHLFSDQLASLDEPRMTPPAEFIARAAESRSRADPGCRPLGTALRTPAVPVKRLATRRRAVR